MPICVLPGGNSDDANEVHDLLNKSGDRGDGTVLSDLMGTASFCWGQKLTLDLISKQHPTLAREAQEVELLFDRKFAPSVAQIGKVMDWVVANVSGYKKEYDKNQRMLTAAIQAQKVSKTMAKDFLETVKKRSKGEIPAPYLRKLLAYHPIYQQSPEKEYEDGFKGEYRSDGKGKAQGLKVGIQHPASWEAKDGRRPHIVKLFSRGVENGALISHIQVRDIPDEDVSETEMFKAIATVEHLKKEFAGAELIGQRVTKLAGRKALELEITIEQDGPLNRVYMHQLQYTFIHSGKMVQVTFAAAAQNSDKEQAKKIFRKHKNLFLLMATSIEVFNRFDVDQRGGEAVKSSLSSYKSDKDGFEAAFPGKPEIVEIKQMGAMVRQYHQADIDEKNNFVIYRIQLVKNIDGKKYPKRLYREVLEINIASVQKQIKAQEISRKDVRLQSKFDAIYVKLRVTLSGVKCLSKRYHFIHDDAIYTVGVVYSPALDDVSDNKLEDFIKSFKLFPTHTEEKYLKSVP